MLTGHQKCNHHVGDISVREGRSILVRRALQCGNHVVFVLQKRVSEITKQPPRRTHVVRSLSSLPDDTLVEFTHRLLRLIPTSVTRQRQLGKHEIDRGKSTIEVFIPLGERLVETVSDFLSLQCSRGSEDGQFTHGVERVKALPGVGGFQFVGEESVGFFGDHADVGSEVFSGKTEFNL